jgi:PEP-CTERM motif
MNQNISRIATLFVLVAGASFASAQTTKTFVPSNTDLSDLDHYYAYTWGIDNIVPAGEVITGAKLTITNIWDWTVEDDILYVNMLDNPASGVNSFYDNQGGGNYFGGQGTVVGTWTDPVGGQSTGKNLVFDLGALGLLGKMNQYAADGKMGFGFDPDCHYFNDGVKLEVTTAPVPEPASFAVLGLGGLLLLKRRKKTVA